MKSCQTVRLVVMLGLCLSIWRCGGQILLDTTPTGATISVFDDATKKYRKMGSAPVNLSSEIASDLKAAILQLKIESEGLLPTYVVVPTDVANDLKLNVNLSERTELYKQIQSITSTLYSIQYDIAKENLGAAQTNLKKFLKDYAFVAVGYMYQAEIDLIKNNKKAAIKSLQKALSLDPKNTDIQELLSTLQTLN